MLDVEGAELLLVGAAQDDLAGEPTRSGCFL
jgi:hypothetical protein